MPRVLPDTVAQLRALADSWSANSASERASFQPWLIQFCEALGVPAPVPPTEHYTFELPVKVIDREGRESTNFIDCWKAGHFALEAKATDVAEGNDQPLRKAFGQVRNYVAHTKGVAPPYLMVVDVPRTLIVWDRWSGEYGGFPAGHRINLATLHERPDDIRLLQDIFTDPAARDPRGRAHVVTKDIAGKLAELSAAIEDRGHEPEAVARFLMRCVFCFFAEDVELLPSGLFKRTLETARTAGGPARVAAVLSDLWKTMDTGGSFGADLVQRFNGHFFRSVEALPLEPSDVSLLIEAAEFDWSRVEPSIFGTLLVRALDPAERHRLGAEYTPREYIERLVEPTVVEPIRDRWTAVQGVVLQLTDETDKKPARIKKDREAAVNELLAFHEWMRGLRFLDPACGSGNFLYVTMAAVKRVELEVLRELERVRGQGQVEAVLDEVHPRQFYGIEVKPWAREIAELTLWIGYHQFWRESHGGRTPPEPVLEDTGTIECRDAVLAWDEIVGRPERDHPDPTPRLVHPVTGELVPDPAATLPYREYVGARQAEWPAADFIIGNPPYLGEKRQRDVLGDGYVDALRAVYPTFGSSVDFVMYWWLRASELVANGQTERAGLITTNSITQQKNRERIRSALGVRATIVWAAPDHPWVDGTEGAAVRVAMTVVGSSGVAPVRRVEVDEGSVPAIVVKSGRALNADLRFGADVADASGISLRANRGIAHQGVKLGGRGFLLDEREATSLRRYSPSEATFIKRIVVGREVAERPRNTFVVDLGLMEESDLLQAPVLTNLLRDRVRPERLSSRRGSYREFWWRFMEPRREMRLAILGLQRFIGTLEVSRHRYFIMLERGSVPDGTLVVVATESFDVLGVLSSLLHICWADAAGGRLGVGNDHRWSKSRTFDPFPFPDPPDALRDRIAAIGERLDSTRKDAIARDERVTMTGMYNVVEKLRAGTPLTPRERTIHEIAACGILKDIHDELDAAVAEAYGWPWPMEREEILERLVALHDERVAQEKAGKVRWLRPDYQIPRFGADSREAIPTLEISEGGPDSENHGPTPLTPWPSSAVEQLAAVKQVASKVGPASDAVAAAFEGADVTLLRRHVDTLMLMGEV